MERAMYPLPFEDGASWTRIRNELAVLDSFLEHAVQRKAVDPRKRSLNPFQGVVLESADVLSSLSTNQERGVDPEIDEKIREFEEAIEAEPAGRSRLGYLATTLG